MIIFVKLPRTIGIWISALIAIFGEINGGCPDGFRLFGKSTCLSDIQYVNPYNIENHCASLGGKPGFPFQEDMWDDLTDFLKKAVQDKNRGYEGWIGVIKKPKQGLTDDGKWKYISDGEEFDPDDYPFFTEKPESGKTCAYVSQLNDYRVTAGDCGYKKAYVCQKEKDPCKTQQMTQFVNYNGVCVAGQVQGDKFKNVENGCSNVGGYLFPLKDEKSQKTMIEAILNAWYCGGVFTGLVKDGDGNWVNPDGSPGPPDSYWEENDPKEEKCSLLRVKHDYSLKFYSQSCDEKCSAFCYKPSHDTGLKKF